jgi:predicted glutamine amidotransferase
MGDKNRPEKDDTGYTYTPDGIKIDKNDENGKRKITLAGETINVSHNGSIEQVEKETNYTITAGSTDYLVFDNVDMSKYTKYTVAIMESDKNEHDFRVVKVVLSDFSYPDLEPSRTLFSLTGGYRDYSEQQNLITNLLRIGIENEDTEDHDYNIALYGVV